MSLYNAAKAFKLPGFKARCTYCSTEYMCAEGPYSICPLCESIVVSGEKSDVDPAALSKVAGIKVSISKGAFLEADENAEALATNQDPRVLYTLASLFKSLSDITYMDVDYSLKAFMEKNADNRNDETNRNKFNSMHLESRNRECLHKCIQILELSAASDERAVYIKAMAEIKLKRYAHASIILDKQPNVSHAFKYAKMVLSTETDDKDSAKEITNLLKAKEINAIFYAAKHLAMKKEFADSAKLLDIIYSFISLPKYSIYKQKMTGVAQAAGI